MKGINNNSVYFRKATPEEIEKAQMKTISVSGQFDVEVSYKGVFYDGENITEFVSRMIEFFEKQMFFDGFTLQVKDSMFKYTMGRSMGETKLSDWKKVWEEYQKLNQWHT